MEEIMTQKIKKLKAIRKLGFKTLEEFKANFVDKDDYIELIKPIGGIKAFQKYATDEIPLKEALEYAKNLELGGFRDWKVPIKKELRRLFKLMKLYGVKENQGELWSLTTVAGKLDHRWTADFYWGYAAKTDIGGEYEYCYFTRCVRVTEEEEKLHEREKKRRERIRLKAAYKLGKEFGFKSGEEFIDNIVDHGDYIELKKPVGGIKALEKGFNIPPYDYILSCPFSYYASMHETGGFNDWIRLAKEDLETLWKIRRFLGFQEEKDCCVRVSGEKSEAFRKAREEEMAEIKKEADKLLAEVLPEWGFKTAEEFAENVIDKGDVIEFKRPVNGVKMIQKGASEKKLSWLESVKYAEGLELGGFKDWRLPTRCEMKVIHCVSLFRGIKWKNESLWSSAPHEGYNDEGWVFLPDFKHYGELRRKTDEFYATCVRVTEEGEHFHDRERALLKEEKIEIRKPKFVREKVDQRLCREEDVCYARFDPDLTGLPFEIAVDEVGAHNYVERHNLRVQMHIGYFLYTKDVYDLVEVDMDGNVYTLTDESEKRWNIKYEDFQALMNYMHNNEYALEMMAQQKVDTWDMANFMIKGGKLASEAEIEHLNELADFFSSDAGSWQRIHGKSDEEVMKEFEKFKAAKKEKK